MLHIIKHKIEPQLCRFGLHSWTEWDGIDYPGAPKERFCTRPGCRELQVKHDKVPNKIIQKVEIRQVQKKVQKDLPGIKTKV